MVNLIKWPSIELLHNVKKYLESRTSYLDCGLPTITYLPKVKLHGTNAGVQILSDNSIVPQSHTRCLINEDNYGFAAWVKKNEDYFKSLRAEGMTIFGEWSGSGINKHTAISKINKKIFAIFAIQSNEETLITNPCAIKTIINNHEDVYIIPYLSNRFMLDFANKEQLTDKVENINKLVLEVEACDPFVKDNFGIEGTGEGIVLYPVAFNSDGSSWAMSIPKEHFANFAFKAKGEKHSVVKQKEPAIIDPEKVNSINEFVSKFVTEQRLEQGVAEACGGKIEMKLIGEFIKWVSLDVKKESESELSISKLDWSDVAKAINSKARDWYKNKAMTL